MKGFRDALVEAGKNYPNLDVSWVEIHERWNERLGELGLDPELFRYQREMNADEGEAAGLFAVKNDSDFTDLLLRAVTDTRDTDGLADLVHGFAHKLGRRAELTAERDFTAGSLDLLSRIADAAEQRETARDVHAGAERRTRTLARRLTPAAPRSAAEAAEFAEQVATAAHAVTDAEQVRERRALISAEIAYRHASLALAAAEKGAAAQRRELNDAPYAALPPGAAAETVLRHRVAADRATRVAAAIREAERTPTALAARSKAAGELVRASRPPPTSARASPTSRRNAPPPSRRPATPRTTTPAAAATHAQRARSEAEHLEQRLAEVEQETADQGGQGRLARRLGAGRRPGPRRARRRGRGNPRSRAGTRRARPRPAPPTRAREAATRLAAAELAAARAEDAAQAAERAYEAERRAAESIGAEQRLADLLGLPQAVPKAGVPGPRSGQPADTARNPASAAPPPRAP
ncbi:hypothetical protein SRIMM317S_05492 [Streptomyces rimosus subsp. rimosus]